MLFSSPAPVVKVEINTSLVLCVVVIVVDVELSGVCRSVPPVTGTVV